MTQRISDFAGPRILTSFTVIGFLHFEFGFFMKSKVA